VLVNSGLMVLTIKITDYVEDYGDACGSSIAFVPPIGL